MTIVSSAAASAQAPPLCSIFRSVTSTRSIDVRTWPVLLDEIKHPKKTYASKSDCPLLKLGVFGDLPNAKGSLRHDDNVRLITGVEVDYDGGQVTAAQGAARLRAAGIRALVYTTPSHTAAAPRWRVLVLLSTPVAPELRHELVSLLNGALGGILADESWTLSQVYYYGRVAGVDYEVHEVDGHPLDVVAYCPDFYPIGPSRDASASAQPKAKTRAQRLTEAQEADPVARRLRDRGMVKSMRHDGSLNIVCPAAEGDDAEHLDDTGETSTIYYLPHTGGFERGNFDCKHGHCKGRPQADFMRRLGFDDVLGDFPDESAPDGRPRFTPIAAAVFASGPPPTWIVKDVLPEAELAVIYGESGSGKSFFVLDIAVSVVRGEPWRGLKTKQGQVVYVAAEGAGGFRKRLAALAAHRGIDLEDLPLSVIPDCPNLMGEDAKSMAAAIRAAGGATMIVIDTLAAGTAGSNENSGEDMGKVLAHCKMLHRATGALVLLVHHSGKDATKGARGWSGIRAAVDAEIEVSRLADNRLARITKQKDGEDSASFGFKLQSVVVGTDEDGATITSCVVVPTDAAPPVRRPIGAVQQRVLQTYNDLAFDGPVRLEDLISAAVAQTEKPIDGEDRRREVVRRAIAKLHEGSFFFVVGDTVQDPQPHNTPQTAVCGVVGTTP